MSSSPIAGTLDDFVCPSCHNNAPLQPVEVFGKYACFACSACELHFWSPRELPDSSWYEQMYGGRDANVLPLEPGHTYFLADPKAPKKGELLDLGCGTGNFLAAARDFGYSVSGTELDAKAAQYAKLHFNMGRVYSLTAAEFAKQNPGLRFDVVTFFEVLEHQASPVEFIGSVHQLLRPGGFIALSVPNRDRWMTGPDVLDYPPNHFLRWNPASLRRFLESQGFEVLSLREQPATLRYIAQMINQSFRTGLTRDVGAESSFREVIQMAPADAAVALQPKAALRESVVVRLARAKRLACLPLAVLAYPYVRLRGLKGLYLYVLARQKQPSGAPR